MAADSTPVATLDAVTHRYGSTEALSRVTLALTPGLRLSAPAEEIRMTTAPGRT